MESHDCPVKTDRDAREWRDSVPLGEKGLPGLGDRMMHGAKRKIYWIDINRFDTKPNKSTWIEMANALDWQGYCVTVLTGFGNEKGEERIGKARFMYFRALNARFMFRASLMLNILQWLVRNATRADIVILTPPALYIAPLLKMRGVKHIHLDVRTVPVEVTAFKGRLNLLMGWRIPLGLLRRFAISYSFITERLKRQVEQEFGVFFPHCSIWSSGVNTGRFALQGMAKLSVNDGTYTLFYHGTLTANRGIDKVVLAIGRLNESVKAHIRFVVVGSGKSLEPLKELAARCGLLDKVIFKGLVPYERIPAEIAAADCCICPLPDRTEWNVSSPLKVFEYLASGKPVILTPIPAHEEILGEEDFVVWSKGWDTEHFAEAIEYAFKQRERLRVSAEQGRNLARERFDWKEIGMRFARYLDWTAERS